MKGARYVHHIPVRYGEVDLQGVVFNAHYLAYVDDTLEHWLRQLDGKYQDLGWDLMLKKAVVEWHGSAGIGDDLDVGAQVVRWGNTSLDIRYDAVVGERPVATITVTYVGVKVGTTETMAPPPEIRALLGEAE
jgi:acyl-CoA thioester hydrolase